MRFGSNKHIKYTVSFQKLIYFKNWYKKWKKIFFSSLLHFLKQKTLLLRREIKTLFASKLFDFSSNSQLICQTFFSNRSPQKLALVPHLEDQVSRNSSKS